MHLRGEVRLGDCAAVQVAAALGQRFLDGGVLPRWWAWRSSASCWKASLSDPRARRCCPPCAALGGMVVPALIYAAINWHDGGGAARLGDPHGHRHRFRAGRAGAAGQPRAAIAEGVPHGGRHHRRPRRDRRHRRVLHGPTVAAPCSAAARRRARSRCWSSEPRARHVDRRPTSSSGLIVWVCVLKSGVHATLAGVITALAIPLADRRAARRSDGPNTGLQPWVTFGVLPLFAFVNAGVSLEGARLGHAAARRAAGHHRRACVVGKATGVFGASWLLVRSGRSRRRPKAPLAASSSASACCAASASP